MIRRFGMAVMAVTLSACGGGDNADQGSERSVASHEAHVANADPCTFISPAELTEITGDVVTRTSKSGESCKYHTDPDDGVETTVSLRDGAAKLETARKSMALLSGIGKEVANEGGAGADTGALLTTKKDSPEIGDESLWGLNGTVYVRKGDVYVEVMPPLMHDPATTPGIPLIKPAERRAFAKAIAERILGNIEKGAR